MAQQVKTGRFTVPMHAHYRGEASKRGAEKFLASRDFGLTDGFQDIVMDEGEEG